VKGENILKAVSTYPVYGGVFIRLCLGPSPRSASEVKGGNILEAVSTYPVYGGVFIRLCLGPSPRSASDVKGGNILEAVHGEGCTAPQHKETVLVVADLMPVPT
jgi:hypothetical protein